MTPISPPHAATVYRFQGAAPRPLDVPIAMAGVIHCGQINSFGFGDFHKAPWRRRRATFTARSASMSGWGTRTASSTGPDDCGCVPPRSHNFKTGQAVSAIAAVRIP